MTFLYFLIPAIACSYLVHFFCDKDFETASLIFLLLCVPLFSASVFIPIAELQSEKKAEFYNKNFGTHYTANDFFWYGEEIENMLIGKKVRVDK